MIAGGTTQYLARVQGMPEWIEKALEKIIRDFIWEGSAPRISLSCLTRPKAEGGIGLLDVPAQNQAIQIMWLKTYLDLSTNRPTWAYIVNVLINRIIPPETTDLERVNTFLQSWDILT